MAVDDHGLEVLKKSGEEVTPGDHSDYYIKTDALTGGILLAKLQEILEAVDGLEALSTRAFNTPNNTRPTVTTTSSEIIAANAARKYVHIFNGSGAVIYIKLGATAVANEGIRIVNNDFFEITNDKLWTGAVNAIRGTGSGAIEVFEGT